MDHLSYIKRYPLHAMLGFTFFFSFLFFIAFFPTLAIAIVVLYYVYTQFFSKQPEKKQQPKPNLDFHTLVKPTSYVLPTGNRYMSASDKQAYLSSPKWKALRQQVLARDNHKCIFSGRTDNLEIHHIHYNNLGDEPLSDLITLNANIHQDLHNLLGYDRNGDYSIDAYLLAKLTHN